MNLYDNDKVKFVVPDTGGMRWNDNLVIPKGGANLDDAHKLIDYYYGVPAATMLSEYVGYFTPVKGVSEQIAADAETARDGRRHGDCRPVRRAGANGRPLPTTRSPTRYTDKQLDRGRGDSSGTTSSRRSSAPDRQRLICCQRPAGSTCAAAVSGSLTPCLLLLPGGAGWSCSSRCPMAFMLVHLAGAGDLRHRATS